MTTLIFTLKRREKEILKSVDLQLQCSHSATCHGTKPGKNLIYAYILAHTYFHLFLCQYSQV